MLNVIVAPKDRVRTSEKYTKKIVKYLKNEKVEYSVFFAHNFDEMLESVEALRADGENEFVLVGDDIAISHFINEVKELNKIKLGIVPVGESNDFSRFLNLESKPVQAIKKILNKEVHELDYLVVNDLIAVNNVSLGASTEALENYEKYKWKINLTKRHALLKYGTKFDGIELNIEVKSNKIVTKNIFELSICNGAYLKGQHISPLSNLEDGLFNLNYITLEEAVDKKRTLLSFYKGEHIYTDDSAQSWINNVKISSTNNEPFKVTIDGRIFSVDELEVTLIEKGLKLYK